MSKVLVSNLETVRILLWEAARSDGGFSSNKGGEGRHLQMCDFPLGADHGFTGRSSRPGFHVESPHSGWRCPLQSWTAKPLIGQEQNFVRLA